MPALVCNFCFNLLINFQCLIKDKNVTKKIIIHTYLINYPLKKKKKTNSQFCESRIVDFNFYTFINPYIISKICGYRNKRIWTLENKINNTLYRSNWCRLHPYIFRNTLNCIWILKHLDAKPISAVFFFNFKNGAVCRFARSSVIHITQYDNGLW